MTEIRVFAPATVANVGSGFDVLGFCLDPIGDIMKISKTSKPGVHIFQISGEPLPTDPKKNIATIV